MDLKINNSLRPHPSSSAAQHSSTQNGDFALAGSANRSGATAVLAQANTTPAAGNDRASFVRAHRGMLADLQNEARTIRLDPIDAARSALNRVGSATGLFDMQMSPQQRVGVLLPAYSEAITRHEMGDPSVSRQMLGDLHRGINGEIASIKTGQARAASLGFSVGAGVADFVRSTSVGLAAGVGSLIGGPPGGALAGGLQSLGTLIPMAGVAMAQGVPLEQLNLPNQAVGDVGNIFTTLAGPKLLSFFNLPGAPTANTMRAIGAHMGRMGLIDGGLDGLFTTVSEATVNRRPIPEALRAGATQGLISFAMSGAFSGPTGFLDARKQGQMVDVVRQMNPGEARQAVAALDGGAANRMRNEQPMIYRALDEQSGGGLTALANRQRGSAPGVSGAPPRNSGSPDAAPSGRQVTAGPSAGDLSAQRAASFEAQRNATLARNTQALDTTVGTSQVGSTAQVTPDNAVIAARTVNNEVRVRNDALANAGDPRRHLDVAIPVRGTLEGRPVDFNLRGSPLALENEVLRLQRQGVVPNNFDVGSAAAQTGTPWNTLRQTELDIRANNLEAQRGTTLFGSTVAVEVSAGDAMRRAQDLNANSRGADPMALYIPLESNIVGSEGAGGRGRAFAYYVNTPDNVRGFFDSMVDQGRVTLPAGQTRDQAFQGLLDQSGVGRSFSSRLNAAQDMNYSARLPEIGGQRPALVDSDAAYQQARGQARASNSSAKDAFAAGDGSRVDQLSLVVPGTGPRGAFADNLTRGETAALLNTMQDTGLVRPNVSLNDVIAANDLQGLVGVQNGRAVALDPNRTLAPAPERPALPPARSEPSVSPQTEAAGGAGNVPPNNPRANAAGAADPGDGNSGSLGPFNQNAADAFGNRQTIENISRAPFGELGTWINDPATQVAGLPAAVREAATNRVAQGLDNASLDPQTRAAMQQAYAKLTAPPADAVQNVLPGRNQPLLTPSSAEALPDLSGLTRRPDDPTSGQRPVTPTEPGSPGGNAAPLPNLDSITRVRPEETFEAAGMPRPSNENLQPGQPQPQPQTQPAPRSQPEFQEPSAPDRLDIIPGPFAEPAPDSGAFRTIPPLPPEAPVFPNPYLGSQADNAPIFPFSPTAPESPGFPRMEPPAPLTGPAPNSADFGLGEGLPFIGMDPVAETPVFQRPDGSLVGPYKAEEIFIEDPGTVAARGHTINHTLAPEVIGRTRATFNIGGVVSATIWLQTGDITTDIARQAQETMEKAFGALDIEFGSNLNQSNLLRVARVIDEVLPQSFGFNIAPTIRGAQAGQAGRVANFGEYLEIKRDQMVNSGAIIYDETAIPTQRYRLNVETAPDGTDALRHPFSITVGNRINQSLGIGVNGVNLASLNTARNEEQAIVLPAGYKINPQLRAAIEASLNNPLDTSIWRHAGQARATEGSVNLNVVVQPQFVPFGLSSATIDAEGQLNPLSPFAAHTLPDGWRSLSDNLPDIRPWNGPATSTYVTGGASVGGNGLGHQMVTRWYDMDPMLNPRAVPNQTPNWKEVGPVWQVSAAEDGTLNYARNSEFEAAIQRPGVAAPSPTTNVWIETPRGDYTQVPFGVMRALSGENLAAGDVAALNSWVRERVRREQLDGTVNHTNAFGAVSGGAEAVRAISSGTHIGEPLGTEAREALAPFFERLIVHPSQNPERP